MPFVLKKKLCLLTAYLAALSILTIVSISYFYTVDTSIGLSSEFFNPYLSLGNANLDSGNDEEDNPFELNEVDRDPQDTTSEENNGDEQDSKKSDTKSVFNAKASDEQLKPGDELYRSLFRRIFKIFRQNRISRPLKRTNSENIFYRSSSDVLSENDYSALSKFSSDFTEDLKIKHAKVVEELPNIDANFYRENGYVMVGGGENSWFSLLNIEALRSLGSDLSVEVILTKKSDYETEFCENILPKLNARCVELSKIFDEKDLKKLKLDGSRLKSLALLASLFENAMFLDSNHYPVSNPDELFKSDLLKEYTMITWPNSWRRTTSPYYYEIAGINIGKQIRYLNDIFTDPKYYEAPNANLSESVSLHNREGTIPDWSSSGQILVNKRKHFRTLLLSLYYDLEGPNGYYCLLSQSSCEEGTKETFVAAANYYKLPYYQAYKLPTSVGGYYDDKIFFNSTTVQYDPIKDYEYLKHVEKNIKSDIEKGGDDFVYDYDRFYSIYFLSAPEDPMFYYFHDPEMDPFKIMKKKYTMGLDGEKIRIMGNEFSFDLEKLLWDTTDKYACQKEESSNRWKVQLAFFDDKNRKKLCGDFIKKQQGFLSSKVD